MNLGHSIAGAVFSGTLSSKLKAASEFASSGLTPDIIQAVHSSVKAIFDLLPAGSEARSLAVNAYIDSVRRVWLVCVPSAILAGIVAIFTGTSRLSKVEGIF